MKVAYFDCFAGAGGDMIVAAMVDAGLDAEFLKDQLATLGIKSLHVEFTETRRRTLRALAFRPTATEQHRHRNLEEITRVITESRIHKQAKETAVAIFNKLADAEASVHGKEPQDVSFHEVGALDSIADIVSASVGFQFFRASGVEKVYCSALSVGGGTVKCAHGWLPVPAPATAELLKGVPIVGGPGQAELLTPTAAAILLTIVDEFCQLPSMKIQAIGYGAGTLEAEEFANVLRLILGETADETKADTDSVCLLETNIDDTSGELVGLVTTKLLENGALDVFTTPIYMKQNRPAVQISVLCKVNDVERVEKLLFAQGLTFGIRRQILQRSKLSRQFVTVATEFGEIKIKVGSLAGEVVAAKPEFSDCVSAAETHKVAVKTVFDAATSSYRKAHP